MVQEYIKFAGLPFVASSIFLLLVLFVSRFSLLRAQKYFNLKICSSGSRPVGQRLW